MTEDRDPTPVISWDTECWKCGRDTPVVWPEDGTLNDDDIGGAVASGQNNVERVYSKTQGREVYGNVCEHCDAYQGNFYIDSEAVEQDPPLVECENCGEDHEWYPDSGMGAAFDQGWIDCPEYGGPIPVGDPRK